MDATGKGSGQSQGVGPDTAVKAAESKGRGRPKGTAAAAASKPDKPQETGAAAAARLFGSIPKRKAAMIANEASTASGAASQPATTCTVSAART
ncbi:hypothetical protein WJX74_006048 [Apatococcus lobatus]|uniref:Uncharacterized protein n=1 Tax=Apatococcus lobatus TaxID=904363 RepID=A0AAW1QIU9_9CHLO